MRLLPQAVRDRIPGAVRCSDIGQIGQRRSVAGKFAGKGDRADVRLRWAIRNIRNAGGWLVIRLKRSRSYWKRGEGYAGYVSSAISIHSDASDVNLPSEQGGVLQRKLVCRRECCGGFILRAVPARHCGQE